MKNPHKALETIAAICPMQKPGAPYSKLFSLIYKIAHSNMATHCKHEDWEREATKLNNELHEIGEV